MDPKRGRQLRYCLPVIVVLHSAGMMLIAERALAWRYPTLLYAFPESPDDFDLFYHVDARFGRSHRPGISAL